MQALRFKVTDLAEASVATGCAAPGIIGSLLSGARRRKEMFASATWITIGVVVIATVVLFVGLRMVGADLFGIWGRTMLLVDLSLLLTSAGLDIVAIHSSDAESKWRRLLEVRSFSNRPLRANI